MAILKHIASKNADYGETERYLIFQHDENTGKMIRDEDGYPIQREQYLLEGFNCNPETFTRECRKVNKQFGKNKSAQEIKSHHYIISFDPEDQKLGLTLEQAQKLGMEFAREHFPGHQVIVCTHADGSNGSGNIHVHLVLNSVRKLDTEPLPYEMRPCDTRAGFKHNCTKPFMEYLRKDLMQLCISNGLNQIDLQQSARRISNEEYRAKQRGQERRFSQENDTAATPFETEKEKLRQKILATISESADPEEFKKKLEAFYGIQVRESRGRWSYLLPGRKQPITGRRLGDAFQREAIERAILGTEPLTFVQNEQKLQTEKTTDILSLLTGDKGINQVVDLEHNLKVKESAGYEHWAKLHNLQEQSKTFNFLTENGLLGGEVLDQALEAVTVQFKSQKADLKKTETDLKEVNRQLRLFGQYYKVKNIYRAYCKGRKQEEFYNTHSAELKIYEAVQQELNSIFTEGKWPSIKELKTKKAALTETRDTLYSSYRTARKQWLEISKLARNRNSFMDQHPKPEKPSKNL